MEWHLAPHPMPVAQPSHAAASGAGSHGWHLSPHRIARRPYKQKDETRTHANHIMGGKSTPLAILRNVSPPATFWVSLSSLAIILDITPSTYDFMLSRQSQRKILWLYASQRIKRYWYAILRFYDSMRLKAYNDKGIQFYGFMLLEAYNDTGIQFYDPMRLKAYNNIVISFYDPMRIDA